MLVLLVETVSPILHAATIICTDDCKSFHVLCFHPLPVPHCILLPTHTAARSLVGQTRRALLAWQVYHQCITHTHTHTHTLRKERRPPKIWWCVLDQNKNTWLLSGFVSYLFQRQCAVTINVEPEDCGEVSSFEEMVFLSQYII